jgi:hypothetical protein
MKIRFIIAVSILFSCLSCNEDKSDVTSCSINGGLLYNPAYERWEIHRSVSDEIIELYVVRNYKINLPKVAGDSKDVQAKGICTQSDEILYTFHDNLPPIPKIICYYIDIKNLNYIH